MGYENFTTFTKWDDASELFINSSTQIEAYQLESYPDGYELIFKYYGENYFSSCTLEVESEVTDIAGIVTTQKKSTLIFLGLTGNTIGQPNVTTLFDPWDSIYILGGVVAYFYNPTADDADLDIILACRHTASNDTYAGASVGTRYYFIMERTNSDCTLYIYDDAPRTSLVDTLSITCDPYAYSYLIASGAYLNAQNPWSKMSGFVENLEIVACTHETPSPSSSYCENFTSFTEVDTQLEDIIIDSTHIGTYRNYRSHEDYIYKNYNANYFNAFIHQVDSCVTSYIRKAQAFGAFSFWGVTNDINDLAWTDGIAAYWWMADSDTLRLYITEYDLGGSDYWDNAMGGYRFYFTFDRSTLSDTVTCDIYQDYERTTLLTTLSVSCPTLATYQYCYALVNVYSSDVNRDLLGGVSEYLKFLNVVPPDDPGIGGPTDFASNAEWPSGNLYVTIPDNQESVTVYFYDADGDTLIGTATGTGGQTVSTVWNNLDCEEEYSWYVVMDNGTSTATSTTWYFTCGSCNIFTIASESHPTIHLSPPRFRDGIQWDLNKEIQRFGFWSENWAVHDNGIDSEPLVLVGWEWIDEDGDIYIFHRKFTDIHDLMNKHEEIAISGLGDCIDGYYYIKNFNFKTIKGAPRAREWKLELEFSREKTW